MAYFVQVFFVMAVGVAHIDGAVFLGSDQDVGSPLRVAQCRATCLQRFAPSVVNHPGSSAECLQGPDCFMCWENCELFQSNYQIWGDVCTEKDICFPGCQEACRFHNQISLHPQQSQPVIRTKGEGVIRVSGNVAHWPRPLVSARSRPLVYVVMMRTRDGAWRQIIQTLELSTRLPLGDNTMLRVLVVDAQGLMTIYSPVSNRSATSTFLSSSSSSKKRKTINREKTINSATRQDGDKENTARSLNGNSHIEADLWTVQVVSLIHQKILVIGEIAWAPRAEHGVYLVTWEVDGGGLKGNLFTDTTSVALSLWPDTLYHIQVELVSAYAAGIDATLNAKSRILDLDTRRAQAVVTTSGVVDRTAKDTNEAKQAALQFAAAVAAAAQASEETTTGLEEEQLAEEKEEQPALHDVSKVKHHESKMPLMSVLMGKVQQRSQQMHIWHQEETLLGSLTALVLFGIMMVLIWWLWRTYRFREFSTNPQKSTLSSTYSGLSPLMPVIMPIDDCDEKMQHTKIYEPMSQTSTSVMTADDMIIFGPDMGSAAVTTKTHPAAKGGDEVHV